MPYSEVQICNIALASVGAESILSLTEENKRARMCANFFDITRDYLLSKFDWPFARAYKELNALDPGSLEVDVPINVNVYQLPSDCKTPRDIDPPGSRDPWYVAKNRLYTSKTGDIFLRYTCLITDPAEFSDTFSNLLSMGLAVRLAPPLTQDKSLTKALYEQYTREQFESWESDANIGNDYRSHDEDPNNDTFVSPDGYVKAEDASRFMESE